MKETIVIKIGKELKDKLKEEAGKRGMTLSSYLKSIIAERDK